MLGTIRQSGGGELLPVDGVAGALGGAGVHGALGGEAADLRVAFEERVHRELAAGQRQRADHVEAVGLERLREDDQALPAPDQALQLAPGLGVVLDPVEVRDVALDPFERGMPVPVGEDQGGEAVPVGGLVHRLRDRERPRVAEHVERELDHLGAARADRLRRPVGPVVEARRRLVHAAGGARRDPGARTPPSGEHVGRGGGGHARGLGHGAQRGATRTARGRGALARDDLVHRLGNGCGFHGQPFVPEKAMPWMNWRCRIMNVISIGSVASSAPAISTG